MSHFILTPFGSAGDVNPFIWMGRLLRLRGHEVEVVSVPMFRGTVEGAGLAFTSVGDAEEYDAIMHHPDLWKPIRGTVVVFESAGKILRPWFDAIAARVRPDSVLVSPFHMFAARMVREKCDVPLVTVHLQPACFLSVHDTPVLLPSAPWLSRLPCWMKRLMLAMPNPAVQRLMPLLKQACAAAGVTPPRHLMRDWLHSPDVNLALFPDWFAAPQPDWPANTHTVGFPLEDLQGQFPLPEELLSWLAQGSRPVLLSPGTGNAQAREFFRVGLEACARHGLRALVGTRFPDQLPSPLPPHAWRFDYLPFSALLRHVGILVHHGGIGTLSQAFAAAVPQLVMPMAHDQPDNAARMQRLGAGVSLPPHKFTVPNVAAALQRLTQESSFSTGCAKLAAWCAASHAPAQAVAALERASR